MREISPDLLKNRFLVKRNEFECHSVGTLRDCANQKVYLNSPRKGSADFADFSTEARSEGSLDCSLRCMYSVVFGVWIRPPRSAVVRSVRRARMAADACLS